MSYNSVGLLDDNLVFTGQCGIEKAMVIKGRKWKKFSMDDDSRYLTGHTKISEFIWCKAFCKTAGIDQEAMANAIEEETGKSYTKPAVGWRFQTIKRFYLWVCLAYLKESNKSGGGGNINNPYYKAKRVVREWVEHLHTLVENPSCTHCRDTGLTIPGPTLAGAWDYCTCKKGKLRKKSLLNE